MPAQQKNPLPKFAAYLGTKVIYRHDDLDAVVTFAKTAMQNTKINPWKNRHCGSAMIWNDDLLVCIGAITDDANGLIYHQW